jgi:hypothetical protein
MVLITRCMLLGALAGWRGSNASAGRGGGVPTSWRLRLPRSESPPQTADRSPSPLLPSDKSSLWLRRPGAQGEIVRVHPAPPHSHRCSHYLSTSMHVQLGYWVATTASRYCMPDRLPARFSPKTTIHLAPNTQSASHVIPPPPALNSLSPPSPSPIRTSSHTAWGPVPRHPMYVSFAPVPYHMLVLQT